MSIDKFNENFPFKISKQPEFGSSVMILGWSSDAGFVGHKTIEYLVKKLGCKEFCEVSTADFFPSPGASADGKYSGLPVSKFYYCEPKNLVFFISNPPKFGWYRFVDSILEVAERFCHVTQIYVISGMIDSCAHTASRKLTATINSSELKEILSRYNIISNSDIKTSPVRRPTLNSFLLWLAKRRNIAGANLWLSVPFYLASTEDPQACRKSVAFLDERFSLGIDFADLDEEISDQKEMLAHLRACSSEVDDCIHKLEDKISLTSEENESLVRGIKSVLNR